MLHSKDVVIAETAGSLHLLYLMDRKTIDSTFWLFSWIMHNKEKKRLPLIFFLNLFRNVKIRFSEFESMHDADRLSREIAKYGNP